MVRTKKKNEHIWCGKAFNYQANVVTDGDASVTSMHDPFHRTERVILYEMVH